MICRYKNTTNSYSSNASIASTNTNESRGSLSPVIYSQSRLHSSPAQKLFMSGSLLRVWLTVSGCNRHWLYQIYFGWFGAPLTYEMCSDIILFRHDSKWYFYVVQLFPLGSRLYKKVFIDHTYALILLGIDENGVVARFSIQVI